jgi:hypothetical protein
MSKSNAWETAHLLLVFNNTNAASIGDATGLRGSSTAGSLYFSLHTNDPGEAGNQTSNEIAYTGYARQAKARSSGDFTVTGNAVAVNSNVDFGTMTAGAGGTATHWGLGTDLSGNGVLLYKGTLSPTIVVANGVTPRINAGTCVTED